MAVREQPTRTIRLAVAMSFVASAIITPLATSHWSWLKFFGVAAINFAWMLAVLHSGARAGSLDRCIARLTRPWQT